MSSFTTLLPRPFSEDFSLPVYTWKREMYPVTLSTRTHTFNPLFIGFLGMYCFRPYKVPLPHLQHTHSVDDRVPRKPLLNQCKYLLYPVQSVIVLISRKRHGAIIHRVKISVDLKKPITGQALSNDGTLEQRISFPVVGSAGSRTIPSQSLYQSMQRDPQL